MSLLVELDRGVYPPHAIDKFSAATSDFNPDNARAMMWLSQLAYETASESKVADILTSWALAKRGFGSNDPGTGLPPKSACFVASGGHEATIVAFSGTDPLKIEDWITDFTLRPKLNVLHQGFHDAVETVWPKIKAAIEARPASEQKLFFTGHSLGGALALIAAERALSELKIQATAVYTFGGPRTGGQDFFDRYTRDLGERTFRLVYAEDIVPTVPLSAGGDFRHVGRLLHCPDGGTFDGLTPDNSDGDDPNIALGALIVARDAILTLAKGRTFSNSGSRLFDRLTGLLPVMIRDHIPASYFKALSIALP